MVSGVFRPTILVPAGFREALSLAEQRLAIAHELAHIQRHDLALNLLLSLTRAFFFFHPFAHLAVRECAAAREESCDFLAVRAAGATPAQYGRFLVGFAGAQRRSPAVCGPATSIGMAAASFRPLKRRLAALSAHSTTQRTPAAITVAMLIGALAGTLPIQFVGATDAPIPAGEPEFPRYRLIDLGTLGGQSSDATAINDRGLIVGGSNYNPHAIWGHAYAIDAAGAPMRDISTLAPYRRGVAHAANDRGEIVVEAFTKPGRPTALFVSADGKTSQTIAGLPDFPYSRPLGINDRGDVAGAAVSTHSDGGDGIPTHAFLYRSGVTRDLGTLGGAYSLANAVNANGVVVGKADVAPDSDGRSATHAFVSDDGTSLRDLGVLPGGTNSVANAVDGHGRVVGTSDTMDGTRHAFLADANGAMSDLGSLPAYPASHALAVTDHGLIVGTAYSGDESAVSDHRAVAWEVPASGAPARVVDLNDRIPAATGWTLEIARSVNSRGQIVGQGLYNGRRRAFLLDPVR